MTDSPDLSRRGSITIPITSIPTILPFLKTCTVVYDITIIDTTITYFCIHPSFSPVDPFSPTPSYPCPS